MKKADKSGALYALILGQDELETEQIGLKNLRQRENQELIAMDDLQKVLRERLKLSS